MEYGGARQPVVLLLAVGVSAKASQALHGAALGVGPAASASVGLGSQPRGRFLEHVAGRGRRHLAAGVRNHLDRLLVEAFDLFRGALRGIAQGLVRMLLNN